MSLPCAHVVGLPITLGAVADVASELETWIRARRREYVCLVNVHLMEEAHRNPLVREALCAAGMALPDGMPIAWLARWHHPGASRIAGADLFHELASRSDRSPIRHFFLGGAPDTLERLVANAAAQYPHLQIVGAYSPPFRPISDPELREIARAVDDTSPDVVWVGLGAPKQELWMQRARPFVQAPLLIGVGAVFDFVAGTRKRAPETLQRIGLEWAYRLATEPRRLASRYLRTNATFAWRVARNEIGPHTVSARLVGKWPSAERKIDESR
jgi:N-acetylglucosaminyldiphosphoundecaprenol N-acetyl-beta-D-mannosaminyltransferase